MSIKKNKKSPPSRQSADEQVRSLPVGQYYLRTYTPKIMVAAPLPRIRVDRPRVA